MTGTKNFDIGNGNLEQIQLGGTIALALAAFASVLVAIVMTLGALQNVSSFTTPMGVTLLAIIALLTLITRQQHARRRAQILAGEHVKRAVEQILARSTT
ncbi:hypothetical protein [Ralstonia sp. ASV6]|uniref:hypothetical protein n=1 Tax=Ralstonia sp. ASV6 TaxID=2795124 RepID=UPI0018ED7A51|nr:hypothetical protein [Ralstonia sp. ASV6]